MGLSAVRKQIADQIRNKPQIATLTQRQEHYLALLNDKDCVIASGPAGTGKTYIACAWAGARLDQKEFDKIILARPNVGVGRTLGLLPGDLKEKIEPWARPFIEIIKQQLGFEQYTQRVAAGDICIEPLEHIRGLTFDSACMIIDEAQNTTPSEMKAFLTRVGTHSHIIISGDESQSDIHNTDNGLAWAMRAVSEGLVPQAGLVSFTHSDVVRSDLCKAWGLAFEKLEKEKREKAPAYHGSLSRSIDGELC